MVSQMYGWMDSRMERLMYGWMDSFCGKSDVWMDGWMGIVSLRCRKEGLMDGWLNGLV